MDAANDSNTTGPDPDGSALDRTRIDRARFWALMKGLATGRMPDVLRIRIRVARDRLRDAERMDAATLCGAAFGAERPLSQGGAVAASERCRRAEDPPNSPRPSRTWR